MSGPGSALPQRWQLPTRPVHSRIRLLRPFATKAAFRVPPCGAATTWKARRATASGGDPEDRPKPEDRSSGHFRTKLEDGARGSWIRWDALVGGLAGCPLRRTSIASTSTSSRRRPSISTSVSLDVALPQWSGASCTTRMRSGRNSVPSASQTSTVPGRLVRGCGWTALT